MGTRAEQIRSNSPNSMPPVSSADLDLGNHAYLIELLPMAAYAVRAPNGVIAWFNSRAADLWGRVPVAGDTDERFCGAHKLFHPDGSYMAHCDTPVALALNTGVPVREQEVIIERPDGSRVTVSVHIDPIRDSEGTIVGVVNFFHDVTERKRAERTTALLAAIVDSSDDAIISKNLDGVITSWNKSAERLYGYTQEEAIGQSITLIIPSDRLSEEATILKQLQRGERIDHFETVRMRKDGTLLDISLTISPVRDPAGRVIGASKVARDITERKLAERALRESEEKLRTLADGLEYQVHIRTQELEQRNAEVLQQSEDLRELSNRLLHSQDAERRHIARELHDSVGQILAAISMNLGAVRSQSEKLDSRGARAVSESAHLIEQASKEIRTISHLLHPPILDLAGLASALCWYVDGFSERSKIKVDLEVPSSLRRLPDETELAVFRIVQECLTNVHRHSGSATAAVRIQQENSHIVIQVRDYGKGIPKERQLELTTSGRTGVGFGGMRERLRHLGGSLEIESDENGTVVRALLSVEKNDFSPD